MISTPWLFVSIPLAIVFQSVKVCKHILLFSLKV